MPDSIPCLDDRDFLIWFTGFWEGEGCLTLHRQKQWGPHVFRYVFQVSQSGKRGEKIMRLIKSKFKVGNLRRTNHKNPSYLPRWEWAVRSRPLIIQIVNAILPYLKFRKEEVREKLRKMIELSQKLRSYHRWTEEDDSFILKNFKMKDKVLAKQLGVTLSALRTRRRRLGLLKTSPPYSKLWTSEDVSLLKAKFGKVSNKQLAKELKRTTGAVYRKAWKLELTGKKSRK